MDFKEVVQWLLDNQYLVLVVNKPILTSKFEREVGYSDTPSQLTTVQISKELTKPTTYSSDPKAVWNKFIEDAEIPWRVKTIDGSTYTVRQYGTAVAKKLISIISKPDTDYNRLVESTKNYYKTTTYKPLLSNYIAKEMWFHAYNEWKGSTKTNIGDGGNRWEDE